MCRRVINNEKGSTFMLSIIGFFLLFLFTATLIFIGNANERYAIKEEQNTKAYYVAKTGAESYINHLEKQIKDNKDITKELDDLNGKTSEPTTFGDGEFDIKIEKFSTGKDKDGKEIDNYRVITTGRVKREESVINAIVKPQFAGGGYKTGDGKIFINKTGQVQIPKVPQLTGAGVSLYSLDKKYDDKVPFHINEPGNVSELFRSLNDRKKTIVKDLNEQERSKYRLEIEEPTDLDSKISKSNPIKIERLVKYKGNIKDTDFEEIEFRYDTNKDDILHYFSKGELKTSNMSDTEIKEGLKSTFLIPIRTVEDYKKYIAGSVIYPPSPQYNGVFNKTVNDLTSSEPLSKEREIIIPKDGNAIFKGGIHLNNGGNLILKTSGNTNIKLDGSMRMGDSNKGEEMTIHADGKVNFYVTGDIQLSGNVKVTGNGEVNFYMYGSKFQVNNGSKVKNINLYAPNTDVQLQNNIVYEGIIIVGPFEMNDNSTFKAPSSGPASTGSKQSLKIEIVWER